MPRQLPTVSIVTPSFNHAAFLEATIRSVLDQNYTGLQYVVMDGGSTDGSVEILRKYADRLQWTSEKDAGQADAIRRGFERASGEVIAWLNSDDCYKPGCIEAAASYLADHPEVALVYGDAEFIRPDGSTLCPCANTEPFSRHRLRHYSDYIVQPSAFFRRSAYEAVGGIDASLHWAMDYDLWLKLAEKYDFAYVPQCWSQYRWLGDNKSAAGSWGRIEEVRRVTRKHGIGRLPAYFRMEAVNLHLQAAKEQWRNGQPLAAVGSMIAAGANALSSPRALKSIFDPHTRRIIQTGKLLRAST
jgi:glycosyltransferase involved in cell wall biosynthesis